MCEKSEMCEKKWEKKWDVWGKSDRRLRNIRKSEKCGKKWDMWEKIDKCEKVRFGREDKKWEKSEKCENKWDVLEKVKSVWNREICEEKVRKYEKSEMWE